MADLSDVKKLIVEQGDQWSKWHGQANKRLDDIELRLNRPGAMAVGASDAGTSSPEFKNALRTFARTGSEAELKAMSTTDDPAGGYLMIPEFDRAVRLIRERVSPLSTVCREVVLNGAAEFKMPFTRSVLSGTWVSEADSRPVTADPSFGLHSISLNETYVQPQISQLLLDTAGYPIDSVLTDMIGHGLATTEATALHSGDGVGKPRGLLTYTTAATGDGSRTLGVIEHIATGSSGAFAANDLDCLMSMVGSLAPQYRNSDTVWLMSRSTAAAIRKIKASTAGLYLWSPSTQVGQPDSLLGFPVVIDDSMPVIAANSYSVALGDFKQAYAIVRGGGLRVLRDPFSVKGAVAFYAFQRIGGALVDDRAVKLLKFASA